MEQAQELRVLRNECREFMTGSTEIIGEATQEAFFRNMISTGLVEGILLREDEVPVAYALLFPDRENAEYGWLSAGVTESARGRGIGLAGLMPVTPMGLQR